MSVATFTKTGNKATTAAKLPKEVFGVEVKSHDLLKQAYIAYQANGRTNNAKTKTRGEVRGGGKKPWRQKGTGRARFGSIRVPIWRGGGITFGPTGSESYSHSMNSTSKKQAIRQALSIATESKKVIVIEDFTTKGKVSDTAALLKKMGLNGSVLLVVDQKDETVRRATSNLANVKATQATYVNVFDVMNADTIVLTSKAVEIINEWLGGTK